MGFLRRLLRGRGSSVAAGAAGRPPTGVEAVVHWRYLLVTAPPEALDTAHSDGLAALDGRTRGEILRRMRTALADLEPGAVVPLDAPLLLRAAARAERRVPGFLERALSAPAQGAPLTTAFATAVVATGAAASFLRGYAPELAPETAAEVHELPDASADGGHDDADDSDDD